MAFVLDVSVAAVWALADESSPIADNAAHRLKTEFALVPPIWWFEIRNLLIVNERRGRLTVDESAIFLDLLSSFPIQIGPIGNDQAVLTLARLHGLSFYDAAYLALAKLEGIPLATLDHALEAAAIAEGIEIVA
jgi:predicted nucleic acid-binding protein